MHIHLTLNLEEKTVSTKGIIDLEARGEFVDYKFAVQQRLLIERLSTSI